MPQVAAGLMEVTQLELYAQSKHDCVVNVMAEFMPVLYGMVRPSHIQRSYLVKLTGLRARAMPFRLVHCNSNKDVEVAPEFRDVLAQLPNVEVRPDAFA